MGQAANRKAWVRACVLQMPRPQNRHTPSAVAPQTQQRILQDYRVPAPGYVCLSIRGWDSGQVVGEALEQVARDDEVQANFASRPSGGCVTTVTAHG